MTTRPRRILMTADAVGGVWQYACELGGALAAAGHAVRLAVMGPEPTAEQRNEAESLGLALEARAYRLEWMDDPWDDVERAGRWLLDLAVEHDADLVHLNGYAHAALPFEAPVLVVAHSCVCSWHRAVRGYVPQSSGIDAYRRHVARGLAAADDVVAPTAAMLGALTREHGPLRSSAVVWNGRAQTRFPPGPKAPVVFAAGRLWDDAKNLRQLARVAPALPWPVRMAGPLVHERGFEDVVLLGRLPSVLVADELARAAIYALPARYEPFGLSALEAALAGCALVLGDIPSLRELWDGDAAFVDPDDDAALARTLVTLMNDAPLRNSLAHRAAARAARYTPEGMRDGYLARYAALPARQKESPRCAS